MTWSVFGQIFLAAVLTSLANLSMRDGLLKAGGLSFGEGVLSPFFALGKQPTFVIGFMAYGLSALVWFRVLSVAEVSLSYPILVGLAFVMVTLGGVLYFGETVGWLKFGGILTILAGIIMVARAA